MTPSYDHVTIIVYITAMALTGHNVYDFDANNRIKKLVVANK